MSAKLRLIPTILLAAACVIALAPLARAAETPTTYQERVVGVETGVPTTCSNGSGQASSFAGGALGTLNGTFSATICHSTLGSTGGTINQGGSFVDVRVSGQLCCGADPLRHLDRNHLQRHVCDGGREGDDYRVGWLRSSISHAWSRACHAVRRIA